ncbi:MAG: HAD family hydrolase [Cetobacterium sp.]
MNKKIIGILFDLDGTVLNTQKMNIIPLQKLILEELGQELSYDDLIKYCAYPGKQTIKMLGFEDIEKSYEKWVKYVNEFEEGATLYEGFEKVFQSLHGMEIKIGIVSSKMRKQYEIDFIPTGLEKYVLCKVLAEDTPIHKPNPEPLLLGADLLKLNPENIIYIGDTIADQMASKNAGMRFALASWGAIEKLNVEEKFILKEPLDILKLLEEVNK